MREALAGQADPQTGVEGEGDRGHPGNRVAEGAVRAAQPAGGLRRDDQRVVAPAEQVLGDPHRGVRDAVDIGWEGLGDICDPHTSKFARGSPRDGRDAVTPRQTVNDISVLNSQVTWPGDGPAG